MLSLTVLKGAARQSGRRTAVDDIVSSCPVFFQTRPTTHHEGLGAQRPPGEMSHICRPTVSYSHAVPPQSLTVSLLSLVSKSPGITRLFPIILYIFLFAHWYCLLLVVSFVFFAYFIVAFLSSTVTRSGPIGPEMEMQLRGYHRCQGCKVAIVDCAKDFLYSRFVEDWSSE